MYRTKRSDNQITPADGMERTTKHGLFRRAKKKLVSLARKIVPRHQPNPPTPPHQPDHVNPRDQPSPDHGDEISVFSEFSGIYRSPLPAFSFISTPKVLYSRSSARGTYDIGACVSRFSSSSEESLLMDEPLADVPMSESLGDSSQGRGLRRRKGQSNLRLTKSPGPATAITTTMNTGHRLRRKPAQENLRSSGKSGRWIWQEWKPASEFPTTREFGTQTDDLPEAPQVRQGTEARHAGLPASDSGLLSHRPRGQRNVSDDGVSALIFSPSLATSAGLLDSLDTKPIPPIAPGSGTPESSIIRHSQPVLGTDFAIDGDALPDDQEPVTTTRDARADAHAARGVGTVNHDSNPSEQNERAMNRIRLVLNEIVTDATIDLQVSLRDAEQQLAESRRELALLLLPTTTPHAKVAGAHKPSLQRLNLLPGNQDK